MADEQEKFQNLGNQAQRVNAAMEFTGGNRDKAVQMAGGGYNDLRVVKGRFAVEKAQIYGGLLMFVSMEQKSLGGLCIVLHDSKDTHDKLRIFDSIKSYYQSLMEIPDKEDATGLFGHLVDCFEGFSLISNIEDKDIESLTHNLNDIVSRYYEVQGAQCQIDLSDTSSLAMQDENIPFNVLHAEKTSAAEDDAQGVPAIEKEADYIIGGKVIVSPVKGKYINDIKVGERIHLLLTNRDAVSMKVAQTLKAINEDNEFLPIRGRVREKTPLDKSGFVLYCLVAKNVLAKIVEEENVKIEMDSSEGSAKDSGSSGSRFVIYIVALVGVILLLLLLIYALL